VLIKHKIFLDETILRCISASDKSDITKDTLKFGEQLGLYETYMLEASAHNNEGILKQIEFTPISSHTDIVVLAEKFISLEILENKNMDVCLNIAAALLHDCDFFVSWNYTHVVNAKTIQGTKIVAMLEDLKDIIICTPTMLLQE